MSREAVEENTNGEVAPVQPEQEEMVTIQLFKDNERYKDDLTVGLNGTFYKIKRGIPVKVPKGVAEIIEHSMIQDGKTTDMLSKLESEYSEEA